MNAGWAVPYRALRPASLVLQVAVVAVAELLLFASYSGHDSRFHWATHFLVALIAATVWLAVYLLIAARPAPLQIGTLLIFHVVAVAPDLLFVAGIPHDGWMDVFFAHVAVHYLPGGDTTWLVLALLALAAYTLLVTRWLRARHVEASRGMAPGIGIGGGAVVHAQRDPRSTPIAHRHAGGVGEPVLLVHGLGGTGAQWAQVADRLAVDGLPSLRMDLLGHGGSIDIGTRFSADEQAAALVRLLDAHGLDVVTVAAHSYGCAVAAELAGIAPGRVRRMLLVCPPAYPDAETARRRIGNDSWMSRRTVAGAPVANLVCGAMCLARGLASRLAPRVRGDLDPDVARGGLQHTYPAIWDAIATLVRQNPLPAWLRRPERPTSILLASGDTTAPPDDVRAVGVHADIDVQEIAGVHELTITQPNAVATFVVHAVGRVRRG